MPDPRDTASSRSSYLPWRVHAPLGTLKQKIFAQNSLRRFGYTVESRLRDPLYTTASLVGIVGLLYRNI